MITFRIDRDPIVLQIPQIVKVGNRIEHGYCVVELDDGQTVEAFEGFSCLKDYDPFKVGDLVRYHVDTDEFRRFNPNQIPPWSTITQISSNDG